MPNETDLFLEELGQDPFEQLNTELEQSEVKQEEEERRQQQIDDITEDKRIEQLIKDDKTNSIIMDIGIKRIKKNARVMTNDNYDTLEYQCELEN